MNIEAFKNFPATLAVAGALACALACGGRDGDEPRRADSPHIRHFSVHPAVIKRGQAAHLHAEFDPGRAVISPEVGPVHSGVNVLVSPKATTTYELTLRTPLSPDVCVRSVTLRVE